MKTILCFIVLLITASLQIESCPDGQYFSEGTCNQCQPGCLTCKGIYDCMTCAKGLFLINDTCTVCGNTLYFNESYQQCMNCPNGCFECNSSNICTIECMDHCDACYDSQDICDICSIGYYYINNTCTTCADHQYFDENYQVCKDCPKGCSECAYFWNDYSANCTSCYKGYSLDGVSCKKESDDFLGKIQELVNEIIEKA